VNIGFIMDNWADIDPHKTSTLTLIHEAMVRDHKVALLYPRNLTIRNNVVYGFFKIMKRPAKSTENMVNFHKRAEFEERLLPLHGFDAMIVRKNPPIDNLMLNFLDSVKDDTLIVNDIDGMRKANNKTYTTGFHDPENQFLPVTHVSKNKEYLIKVIRESPSEKMILKPLHGYGGNGVIVLEKSAMRNINSLLEFYTTGRERDYVIVQEYIEGAEAGDVRVLMLGGKPIGAYRRVPSPDDYRANIHAGGHPEKHTLSAQEKAICEMIGPRLRADGLHFVGVDIIGGKLIEINVLNPGGIVNINRLAKAKLQRDFWDYVEERAAEKDRLITEKQVAVSRKLESRREVQGK